MYDYDSFDGMWNEATSGDDDTASESEFRRTRVTLKGTSGKSWAYKMTIDIEGNEDGGAEIDTAYLAYKGLLMVGRFKAPFGLEELTSSKWISTIERSAPLNDHRPLNSVSYLENLPFRQHFMGMVDRFSGSWPSSMRAKRMTMAVMHTASLQG